MGKAKPLKKAAPSKPLKISTSLFKRRLSKNSSGKGVDNVVSTKATKKGTVTGGGPSTVGKGKPNVKEKEESKSKPEIPTSRRASSSPTPVPSKLAKNKSGPPKKGKSTHPSSASTKNGAASDSKKKVDGSKGKQTPKSVQKRKEKSPKSSRGRQSSSSSENSSNNSSSSSEHESSGSSSRARKKKVSSSSTPNKIKTSSKSTNRKGKKSETEPSSPEEKEDDEEQKNKSGSDSSTDSGSGSDTDSSPTKKKQLPKKKVVSKGKSPPKVKKKAVTKKIVKKTVSILASKKKLPIKGTTKAKNNSKSTTTSKNPDKKEEKSGKSKTVPMKKGDEVKNKKDNQGPLKKSKVKPRPKINRMASLNAKAILEASFSFENQEKRQRSPVPGGGSSSTKIKEESNKFSTITSQVASVSVSTSSPPPSSSTFIPIQNVVGKAAKVSPGERKRKSSDVGSSRRESTTSNKSSKDPNHHASASSPTRSNSSKTSSRRNSTVVAAEEDGKKTTDKKGSKKKETSVPPPVSGPKKKSKVSVSTTSTSTGTSPPPTRTDFHSSSDDKQRKQKAKKQKGAVGQDTATFTGGDRRSQESGVQTNQVKSAGSQAKERKSANSAAHFGTVYQPVYQPAGPLIEPHKSPSATGGLPETVKLPPDLKVTYQTHPPTSNNPSTTSHPFSSKASGGGGSSRNKHGSTSTTSSHSHHKSTGHTLHQPYKSSTQSASSSRQQSYSSSTNNAGGSSSSVSSSYVNVINPATATGSPLHLSQPAMSHGHGHHSVHHSQHLSASQSQLPSASAGAPSAGGLFYSTSTGFAPHHSPFAQNKYPMVPESYRTQSPYQNSFLYPSTTPAQQQTQQSYFMTPFYTPPLTPNSGLGAVVGGHHHGGPRPLALTHPSIASAPFYATQQSAHLQPGIGMHPSSYLVASPHHSLQPTPPPAGVGAGRLFPHNPSTQVCPTESCPPNSTNNNNRLQQQQCVSSGLHPAHPHEMGSTKPQSTKALSSRRARQPPTFTEDTPPITIQLLSAGHHHQYSQDGHHTQARHMESAKTFTEQYSLPDDITITPIIVNNSNSSSNNGSALLLKNTSISLISPPTNSPKSSNTSHTNVQNNSRTSSSAGVNSNKKKEKDIVHVIDPRSGLKTTIAKHISNRNLLVKNNVNKSPKAIISSTTTNAPVNARPGGSMKKIGVGKLNPDLDVIVINNNNGSSGGLPDCDDSITENLAQYNYSVANRGKKVGTNNMQQSKKLGKKSSVGIHMGQLNVTPAHGGNNSKSLIASGRRAALTVNDNSDDVRIQSVPINYSLPPGISISSGGNPTNFANQNQNQGLNLTVNKSQIRRNQNDPNVVQVQAAQNHHQRQLLSLGKGKKRISLNDCIDELQKKRLKVLEDPHAPPHLVGPILKNHSILNGSSATSTVNGGNFNVISKAKTPKQFVNASRLSSALASNFNNANTNGAVFEISNNGKKKSNKLLLVDSSYSSARVRDPLLHRGGTVIKSSDALAAVSALVVDPDTYHLKNSRLGNGKGLKNGFKRGSKLYQGKNLKSSSYLPPRDINFVVGVSKVKSKGMSLEKAAANYLSTRNTRSTAANAKIRTRFSSNRPQGGGGGLDSSFCPSNSPRNRSRLLRKGNQIIGVVVTGLGGSLGGSRRSESDSSTNTSRSNSAVRIINGNVSSYPNNSRMERENRKYPTAAFINAVADLYQYRRNVLLRVPRAGVGIFPSANSVNLEKDSSISPGQERSSQPLQQLSPPTFGVPNHNVASLPRSSSPATTTISKGPVGSMAANAAKKRAMVKPLSPQAINGALLQMGMARQLRTPKWSNGWRFEGEPYESKVFLNNDDPPVLRRCYPAMRHEGGDVIQTRDCVLLKSGSKKNDLPYIAKIATLWENPTDGEMMSTLLWYYRPEHTEMGRQKEDMPDEIFASKHIDINSVATIDDRCYVLTFNEYSRYRKRLKQLQEGLPNKPLLSLGGSAMHNNAAGNIASAVWSGRPTAEEPNRPQSPGKISPEVVFFCRKVYDFRQKRIMKNPS